MLIGLLLVTMLFGLWVVAQETGIPTWEVKQWFGNPLVFMGVVLYFTAEARKKLKWIDGKFLVAATASVIGAALGVAGQMAGLVAVEPFNQMPLPWGGIAFGVAVGLTNFLGVSVFDLLANRALMALLLGLLKKDGSTDADKKTVGSILRDRLG